MVKRIIVALIAIAILLVGVWLHGWYIAVAFAILSLFTQYEMITTVKKAGVHPVEFILYPFTAAMLPVYYFGGLPAIFVMQMFAIALIFVAGIIFKRYDYESIFSSVFNLYYPQLFFVFLYMIIFIKDANGVPDPDLSRLMILIAFACSTMTDTFAYFAGTFLGKTPLCPHISPKKTVEGALSGILGGVIGVEVMALIMDNGRIHLIEYAVFAVVLSVLAQIGDLAASVVKRRYGAKDFGKLLPGHGGVLDRLDSTLFILPIIYMFYKIYLNL